MLNSILGTLEKSPTLWMNEKVWQLRQKGEKVIHFGFGESPFLPHKSIIEALKENAHHNEYLPSQGDLSLRENVSAFHKHFFNQQFLPEDIVIGPGSKELLFDILFAMEGDVLIPAPSWVSYAPMARLSNKKVIPLQTHFETQFKITKNLLEEDLKKAQAKGFNPKIIILTSPSNPTALLYTKKELEELSCVFRKHKLIVLSDEIYALTTFAPVIPASSARRTGGNLKSEATFCSISEFYPEGSIVTSGISKDRSCGGYRLGVALFPKELAWLKEGILKIITETFSCVSAPIQLAAVKAYDLKNEPLLKYIHNCTALHKRIQNYAYQRLKKVGILVHEPQGAFYQYPDFSPFKDILKKKGILKSQDLSQYLLEKEHVATLPSVAFLEDESSLRLRLAFVDYEGENVLNSFIKNKGLSFNIEKFIQKEASHIKEGLDKIEGFLKS
ncbi:MAG: pyridoxal phosphate-dependent aminotransferase [Deltaproteobacteria bacterium]|nr:pyridoxal phosphate-dependent aminotransferase [Deltaproteobacteria bacterium]